MVVSAAEPAWWSEGIPQDIPGGIPEALPPVWNRDAAANNKGPANIGQAKWMVRRALDSLRTGQPEVADAIETDLLAVVDLWVPEDKEAAWIEKQKAPLLVGQLKAIAHPFYNRLNEVSPSWVKGQIELNHDGSAVVGQHYWMVTGNPDYTEGGYFPWNPDPPVEANRSIAVIGQLKALFSLRFESFGSDTDGDGLLDSWEITHFSNLAQTGDGDPDHDGLINLQEHAAGTDPNGVGVDNDGDGMPDDWELANSGGFAVYPPVLSASLLPGRTGSGGFLLRNDTGAPVNYGISLADHTVPSYSHVDSVRGGIPFIWQDIRTTGTRLAVVSENDDASEPIPVGIPFDLYGVQLTNIHVCSNGFLTIAENRTDTTGQPLPSVGAPAGLIAPLWDDLNPAAGGDIFYQAEADRLIVQYQDVHRYDGLGSYTFQIVLFTTGEIEFRYLSVAGATASCTVGIQDAAGEQGHQVPVRSTYPASGVAIRFIRDAAFFNVTPFTGTIPPHSVAAASGIFRSLALPAGTHTARITIDPEGVGNSTFSGLARLTVLADSDSDGISDEWEILHGLDPDRDDANQDSDQDGYPNLDEFENNTDPHQPDNTSDTDGDTMWDRWETLNGLNPLIDDRANDPDLDNLANLGEFQEDTHPQRADSDFDGMPDGWEVTHRLNPRYNDATGDPDVDGFTNLEEYQISTDPQVPNDPLDLDDDGMFDAWESRNGLDPTFNDSALDPDHDGLANLREFEIRTKPNDPDTDEDSLPDGWEDANRLDPKESTGEDGKFGDPDDDDASNFLEWQYGCDPHDPDTDGDGANDGLEITQGSDPKNPGDGGQPPPADKIVDVPFRVGDPSGSHSETWCLKIIPKGPDDLRQPIKVASENYGEMAEQTIKLWKGNKYEIVMEHLRTDPEYLEDTGGESDFDWEAQIDGKPATAVLDDLGIHNNGDRYFIVKNHWIVDNEDGLLGTVDQSFDADDYTPGKKATMMPVDFKLRNDADVVKGWDSTEAEDWTSVGVGKTNSIVRLSILGGTADLGSWYELAPAPGSETYFSLPDPAIDGETTDFDIVGGAVTAVAGSQVVVREKANHGNTAGILNTHVFAEDEIPTSIFYIYDDRVLSSRFGVALSAAQIIDGLNNAFEDQCNVRFALHSSRTVDIEQIPRKGLEGPNPTLFYRADGSFSKGSLLVARGLTDKLIPKPAKLTILVVKDIHEPNVGGATGAGSTTATCVIQNTTNTLIYSHEVGHALKLAYKRQGNQNAHDAGPWPKELSAQSKVGLMYDQAVPGLSTWLRWQDWRISNIQADRLK